MMIKATFNRRFHSHMRRHCKVVAEGNGEVIYTAISDVKVDAADLAMTARAIGFSGTVALQRLFDTWFRMKIFRPHR